MDNKVIVGLVALGGAYALSKTVEQLETRIIVGDIAFVNSNLHLLTLNLSLEMPIKNATTTNISFDGFVGGLQFRGHKIADINILQTVQLTAGQIAKIPIDVTIYNTTLISEAVGLWEDFLKIIRTRKFNEELWIEGVVYSGALSFNIKKRVF